MTDVYGRHSRAMPPTTVTTLRGVTGFLLCWTPLMNLRYTALTNVQFLLAETTFTAQELAAGRGWPHLRQAAQEGHLYGPGTASSQLTVLTAIKGRLAGVSDTHLNLLATGTLEQRQILNLALVTRRKQLLLDFLAEVLMPRWKALDRQVTDADARTFLTHKAEQEADVAAWTPATVQKTRGNLTRFLQDAGVLKETGQGSYAMVPQYLTPATKDAVLALSPRLLPLLEALS